MKTATERALEVCEASYRAHFDEGPTTHDFCESCGIITRALEEFRAEALEENQHNVLKLDDALGEVQDLVEAFTRHVELTHAGLHHEGDDWRKCKKMTCHNARAALMIHPIKELSRPAPQEKNGSGHGDGCVCPKCPPQALYICGECGRTLMGNPGECPKCQPRPQTVRGKGPTRMRLIGARTAPPPFGRRKPMADLWKQLVCSWLHRGYRCYPARRNPPSNYWHCMRCHPCLEVFAAALRSSKSGEGRP